MMDEDLNCIICQGSILTNQQSSKLTQKGCDGINKASKARGSAIVAVSGQYVHQECRKTWTKFQCIEQHNRKRNYDGPPTVTDHTLRSSTSNFEYDKQCLFCGQGDPRQGREQELKLIPVRTFDFQKAIVRACSERNDEWAIKIKGRIDFIHDLLAADAVYHKSCSNNFRIGKSLPQKFQQYDHSIKRMKSGRPQDLTQAEAFTKVIKYLEDNDEEQITINNLIEKMAQYLNGTETPPYGFTYMKEQLQKQLEGKIIITELNGKPNVVTMWRTATNI